MCEPKINSFTIIKDCNAKYNKSRSTELSCLCVSVFSTHSANKVGN